MATPLRSIAVCVDDFGLHAGVNEAVLGLARRGRISATSCMVGGVAWRPWTAALRALDPATIDVGLHLDLTQHPLDARLRHALPAWLLRSYAGLAPPAGLRAEIEAQLDAFEAGLGRPPAHVDGHQHVHQLPGVRAVLLDVLAARYPGQRPWLRNTRPAPGERVAKARLIEQLGSAGLARLAARKGFGQNGHLLGVYDFQGNGAAYLALLGGWLRQAAAGDLLMCHPASKSPMTDRIGLARRTEYLVLSGPACGELLARAGVRIAPLTAVLDA